MFSLFSQTSPLQDLGLLDPKVTTLKLAIAGREFTITQSPGSLQSERKEGTTGAAVWQTSVRVAEWLDSSMNILFTGGLLEGSSKVLELGSGISGIVPCVLAPKVDTVVATDQQHLLKILRENIAANSIRTPAKRSKAHAPRQSTAVRVISLDWEEDDAPNVLAAHGFSNGAIDVIFTNDCIYNYALIDPLMQTCRDICTVRCRKDANSGHKGVPTVFVIDQQLRQAEVFEQWLQTALRWFRVWRVPDELLTDGLKGGSGFTVHVCILRVGDLPG